MQMDEILIAGLHLSAISFSLPVLRVRKEQEAGVTHTKLVERTIMKAQVRTERCVYFKSSWLIKVATVTGCIFFKKNCAWKD